MYEKLAGLRFSGAAFSQETTMVFFSSNEKSLVRASLIFGKNGSGKSTISNAILNSCNRQVEGIQRACFVDAENKELKLLDHDLAHVFVFNENYTEHNVRFKLDGLETIVMLGEQGDLDEKLRKAESALQVAVDARKGQEEVVKKYSDRTSVNSPEHYIEKMTRTLQGDDHWAGRERIISGNRTNAPVKSDTYKRIAEYRPTATQAEIRRHFEKNLSELTAAADESARIVGAVPVAAVELDRLARNDRDIVELLALRLQRPELSEREKSLFALIESGKMVQLDEMQRVFSDLQTEFCPFCLQSVSSQHKATLVEKIQKVLNREVEEHRLALETASMRPISLNLSPFSALDASVIQRCERSLDFLNKAIELCSARLREKGENIYSPVLVTSFHLEEKGKSLIDSLQELERCRKVFNSKFDQIETIRQRLRTLNLHLAFFEIEDLYTTYKKQKQEREQAEKKLNDLVTVERESAQAYSDLLQEKKSIRIAVDVINRGLQYVFFSTERLRIEVKDDVYTLTSNGCPVRPSDVSSGERNIISLCYFFADVMKDLESQHAYSRECFLIIDDPVSSFDLENRIGILSYLKSKMLDILSGNGNSKVLVMTHDLSVFFDLGKILGEVKDAANSKYGKGKTDYSLFELSNRALVPFKERKRHEYSELIRASYEYAAGRSIEYELVIGNIMRRALEAFSTFEYKKGIDAISCDEKILASMGDDAYSTHFQNLMYRLVLNGESHTEEKVRSLSDSGFSSMLTTQEKQQTAKDVLCLMYVLNPDHVEAHLSEVSGSVEDIQGWCESIRELHK